MELVPVIIMVLAVVAKLLAIARFNALHAYFPAATALAETTLGATA